MTTADKLNRLADLQSQADVISQRYQEMIDSLITPDILAQIADIEAEKATALEALQEGISRLTSEVKAEVLGAGATVKGAHLMAVWANGRVSWDTKKLDGYAAAHQELLAFRSEGEPSVSIRGVK